MMKRSMWNGIFCGIWKKIVEVLDIWRIWKCSSFFRVHLKWSFLEKMGWELSLSVKFMGILIKSKKLTSRENPRKFWKSWENWKNSKIEKIQYNVGKSNTMLVNPTFLSKQQRSNVFVVVLSNMNWMEKPPIYRIHSKVLQVCIGRSIVCISATGS